MNITQEELEYQLWSAWQNKKYISLIVYRTDAALSTLRYLGDFAYEKSGIVVITLGSTEIKIRPHAKDITWLNVDGLAIEMTVRANEDTT